MPAVGSSTLAGASSCGTRFGPAPLDLLGEGRCEVDAPRINHFVPHHRGPFYRACWLCTKICETLSFVDVFTCIDFFSLCISALCLAHVRWCLIPTAMLQGSRGAWPLYSHTFKFQIFWYLTFFFQMFWYLTFFFSFDCTRHTRHASVIKHSDISNGYHIYFPSHWVWTSNKY